jgi:hypothetical protein
MALAQRTQKLTLGNRRIPGIEIIDLLVPIKHVFFPLEQICFAGRSPGWLTLVGKSGYDCST